MIWTQSVTSSAAETDGVRTPIIRATIAKGVLKLRIKLHLLTSYNVTGLKIGHRPLAPVPGDEVVGLVSVY